MGKKNQGLYILIITGLSGAGKTQVINCLEDIGYYCVDNLPPTLISKFVELSIHSEGNIRKIALVIDVRGGNFFDDLSEALGELKKEEIRHEIIFLEASDEVLVRRYKESRRRHPLAGSSGLIEALKAERAMLEELRGQANLIIDTSNLSPRELKEKLTSRFSESESEVFSINLLSFGYKMGMPLDADIVIDVRFLPNPFYDPLMQKMTGKDHQVINFVLDSPVTKSFNRRFINLLKYLIPYYIEEGKTNLTVAIGCTGGQHRSVVLAEYTGRQLKKMGYNVIIRHRDVAKYKVEE
jgi:UPF0042 nucleotide-binding protein